MVTFIKPTKNSNKHATIDQELNRNFKKKKRKKKEKKKESRSLVLVQDVSHTH